MIHLTHRTKKEEIIVGWGSEEVDICQVCGAFGLTLAEPCVPPPPPKPARAVWSAHPADRTSRPPGWGQE